MTVYLQTWQRNGNIKAEYEVSRGSLRRRWGTLFVEWMKVFASKYRAGEVSELCCISRSALYHIRTQDYAGEDISKTGRKSITLDEFDKRALTRLVLNFYRKPTPEIPTLNKIHEESKLPGFPQLGQTLHTWLKKTT